MIKKRQLSEIVTHSPGIFLENRFGILNAQGQLVSLNLFHKHTEIFLVAAHLCREVDNSCLKIT